MFYKMNIAGVERELPLCPLNENLYIGAFVMFGDVEITVKAAEALCSTAVNTAPTTMPRMGLEKEVRMRMNSSLCFSGAMAPLMDCMPLISTENASIIMPMFFLDWLLQKK